LANLIIKDLGPNYNPFSQHLENYPGKNQMILRFDGPVKDSAGGIAQKRPLIV